MKHINYGDNRTSDNLFVRLLYNERYTQLTMQTQTHRKIITIAILNLMLIGIEMAESYMKSITPSTETQVIQDDLAAIDKSLKLVRDMIDNAKQALSYNPKDAE